MRYGFVLPGGTATEQLELAVLADQAGWDGIFSYEVAYGVDPWTLLSAMAVRTTRVRLGTILTPIPWRRPWKLASQVVTLDQVSNGRAIVAVGLGAVDNALGNTGEELDRRRRADMMDEGIDLMAGLFDGNLTFQGQHYTMDLSARTDLARTARPVQRPRPPIWVVGVWPRMKSMRRVLRCDGILPSVMPPSPDQYGSPKPEDIRAIRQWLTEQGKPPEFDIISEGETPADDAAKAREQVSPWEEAGCTWWLETRWSDPGDQGARGNEVRRRIEAGPPRV